MNIVNVSIQPVVFHFDPGADPKPGQSWDINQDVQIGDARARILKAAISTTMGSPDLVFEFDLQVEPNALADVSISIPINQCNGGGPGEGENPQYGVNYSLEYASMPKGKFNVIFTARVLDDEQSWTLPWQP